MKRFVIAVVLTTLALLGLPNTAFAQPTNDDFDNATVVTEPLPFTDSITTVDATTAADDPECFGNGHTVWYEYTPSTAGFINANTFGSDYDTTLSVYTGIRGELTQIACNDDSGDTVQSSVTWEVVPGATYHLMAGSFVDSPGGNLSLTVQQSGPPPTLDVTIDPIGHVNPRAGVAQVSGTFTCMRLDFLDIFGELQQVVGRFTIRGFFEFFAPDPTCDGTAQPWTANVSPENGKFAGGKATATVSAFGCGPDGCVDDFAQRGIRLRR
jgi:hypothetical protein